MTVSLEDSITAAPRDGASAEDLPQHGMHNNDAKAEDLVTALAKKFICREDRVGQAIGPMSVLVTGKDEILKRLEKHLSGGLRLGVYGLLRDGTLQWAVVELEHHGEAADEDRWLADAVKFQRRLLDYRIPSMLERSKNRNGQCYHLHIAFDSPLPARDVLEGLRGIGKELFGTFPNEIFPKGHDGFGCFLWLPLFGGTDDRGQGVNEGRTVFIDSEGRPFSDQFATLEGWRIADSRHFLDVIQPLLAAVPAVRGSAKNSTGIELNQPGLLRMVDRCPIIKAFEADPTWVTYDQWIGIASNYRVFEGGWKRFTGVSSRDAKRFDQKKIDQLHDDLAQWKGPQTYRCFQDQGCEFELPEDAPDAPAGWGRRAGEIESRPVEGNSYLAHDEMVCVRVADNWEQHPLSKIKQDLLVAGKEIAVQCPRCDDKKAIVANDTYGFTFLECRYCRKKYYEDPIAPQMFAYSGKIYRVCSSGDSLISMEEMEVANFSTSADYHHVRKVLLNDPQRLFLSDDFQIRRMGSVGYETLDCELITDENALVFKYPAIADRIADNALIDRFLDDTFLDYSGFIKDWLAMYCYTNYVTLPVIVLTGERSCGKGTFANMVMAIFPKLGGLWNGDANHFNDCYEKKLLFVDENPNSDKLTQYTEIKNITGNGMVKINKKYQPEYYVRNNIKIIIATNARRPIFLRCREEPKSPAVNTFFIHKCPEVPVDKIDSALGRKIEERLGNYVRTELRSRFDGLAANSDQRNRYALPCPITTFAGELYASSKTGLEEEAVELAEHILEVIYHRQENGKIVPDPFGTRPVEYQGAHYVLLKQIRTMISDLGLKASSNPKQYVEALINIGFVSHEGDYRTGSQRLGHKILKTSMPGIEPEAPADAAVCERPGIRTAWSLRKAELPANQPTSDDARDDVVTKSADEMSCLSTACTGTSRQNDRYVVVTRKKCESGNQDKRVAPPI